jgi:HAD superfamily hydrolase (TIGR01549 family)
MMIKTALFDLDDTLLGNMMDQFLPRYFALLAAYARPLFADEQQFIKLLVTATQVAIADTSPSSTVHEAFWAYFAAQSGLDPAEAEPFFDQFYETEFPQLAAVTEARPEAVKVIEGAFDRGWQVVIATNPLFPRRAIEQRLEWAGVPVAVYPYHLVTTYETMHATKPHTAYYQEILDRVGGEPYTTLMVGDDWKNDMVPAGKLGLRRYWVTTEAAPPPDAGRLDGFGSLYQFYEDWIVG